MGSASKKRKVFPGESRRQAFLPAIEIPAGRKSEPAFIWREKMTLREAAEKALMALTFAEESGRHWPMAVKMARNAAIETLRAALAAAPDETIDRKRIEDEAQNFFEWPDPKRRDTVTLTSCVIFAAKIAEMVRAELAKPDHFPDVGKMVAPQPAGGDPLTDERIKAIYARETGFDLDSSPVALMDFARAVIEAAHGIGGKHD